MVMLMVGLLATTAAMGQPYGGQGYVGQGYVDHSSGGHGHPWAPTDARPEPYRVVDPALWAPARAPSSWAVHGDAGAPLEPAYHGSYPGPDLHGPFPEGFGPAAGGGAYGPVPRPLTYSDFEPRFQPWTPEFPGAPNPLNTRSGGNPGMGFWEVAPSAFRYRRVPVGGGPRIYAHGWYTPWGDYEGVMIIRGNAREMFQGSGY